jgi:iron complex outermembrane receptor protein
MKKYLVICVLIVNAISLAFSQQSETVTSDTINLEVIIVTGSPVQVNKNNVPMAVSVVTREQIAESSESALLPVLNGRIPGLFITERGITGFGVATGAAGQISMRGLGGSPTTRVLMLIDGHPQFMGIFGHPLADSYVASDVEKVEVIRGPASILYGSNAMGGVINIITRKQSENGLHGNANISFGSYNTQKYMANLGYRKNKFSAFASFNHDRTNGHRDHSDFSIYNGYIKAGYDFSRHIRMNTDLSLARFKASDPGPDTVNARQGIEMDILRGYWSLNLENDFDQFSGMTKLFYNFGEHEISDGFHSVDDNMGISIHESARLFKGNNITLGADYISYGGIAENELAMGGQGMVFGDTVVYEAGIYGFVQQTFFEKLTMNAGLRLQDHKVYGQVWIPAAGFAWKVAVQTTWKANVSKGFRSPTIQELFIWNHNPNLNPEQIMNYETGILQTLFNQRLSLELTGFYVTGDNLIVNVPMQGLQNAGSVSNKGLEFSAAANLTRDLALNVTYSYIGMKSPVYATPRQNIFGSVRYQLNRFRLSASVQHIDQLDTDASAETHFENYTLLNARITYRIFKFAELYLSGENMLHQNYETNRYYPMPGITLFGGVYLKF